MIYLESPGPDHTDIISPATIMPFPDGVVAQTTAAQPIIGIENATTTFQPDNSHLIPPLVEADPQDSDPAAPDRANDSIQANVVRDLEARFHRADFLFTQFEQENPYKDLLTDDEIAERVRLIDERQKAAEAWGEAAIQPERQELEKGMKQFQKLTLAARDAHASAALYQAGADHSADAYQQVAVAGGRPVVLSKGVFDAYESVKREEEAEEAQSAANLAGLALIAMVNGDLPKWRKVILALLAITTGVTGCVPVVPQAPVVPASPGPETPGLVNDGFVFSPQVRQQLIGSGIDVTGCQKPEQFFRELAASQHPERLGQLDQLAVIAAAAVEKSGKDADISAIQCDVTADGSPVVYLKTKKCGILIPTHDGYLIQGQVTSSGKLEVVSPPMTPPPDVDRRVNIPSLIPVAIPAAGGAVPEILRRDVARDEASFRASLVAGGIDVSNIVILFAQKTNGPYEWMHYAKAIDGSFIVMPRLTNDQLARPDYRATTGNVKFKEWIKVSRPPGVSGNITAGFIDGVTLPQVLIVDTNPDANGKLKVLAVLDQVSSKWVQTDGSSLATSTPSPTLTPRPSPTPDLEKFAYSNIDFPKPLQSESNKDGLVTKVMLSKELMKNTGITDISLSSEHLNKIGRYILGVLLYGNSSAFLKEDLKNADKLIGVVSDQLSTGALNIKLKQPGGNREINTNVTSLLLINVTLEEYNVIMKNFDKEKVPYVEYSGVSQGTSYKLIAAQNGNELRVIQAGNFSGGSLPNGEKLGVYFEAYNGPTERNATEKLLDFIYTFFNIERWLLKMTPRAADTNVMDANLTLKLLVPECAWYAKGGRLNGCDIAAAKIFSPKYP